MEPVPVTPVTPVTPIAQRRLSELPLEPAPRSRLSLGTGAAVLLVLVTMAVAVLVTMVQPQGGEHPVLDASGGAAALPGTDGAGPGDAGRGIEGPGAGPGDSGVGQTRQPDILVHVLGAVAEPGVYALAEGSRAVDAVAAAGGFSDDADPAALNLAQPLGDGQQLRVPRRGEAVEHGAGSAGGAGASGSAGGAGADAAGGRVAPNSADAAALQRLPGIGPALAQRILQWREANGRFRSIDELMDISGIGRKTFEGLRSRVTL